jgi:hypothetical protein
LDKEAIAKIIQRLPIKDKDGKEIGLRANDPATDKTNAAIVYTGFVAQDVEKAAKSLNYDFSGVDAAKNDKDLYGLRYAEFVVPLVKAVQELSQQNDSLKQQISDLQTRLSKIESAMFANPSQTSLPVSTQSVELSATARLDQNIPNPFNGTTTIGYYVPSANNAAYINFYASSGALLKSVKLDAKGSGTVNVKASELPAGVYQYALIVDGKVVDRKQMVQSK